MDIRNIIVFPKGLDITLAAPLFSAGIIAFYRVEDCGLKPGQWIAVIQYAK